RSRCCFSGGEHRTVQVNTDCADKHRPCGAHSVQQQRQHVRLSGRLLCQRLSEDTAPYTIPCKGGHDQCAKVTARWRLASASLGDRHVGLGPASFRYFPDDHRGVFRKSMYCFFGRPVQSTNELAQLLLSSAFGDRNINEWHRFSSSERTDQLRAPHRCSPTHSSLGCSP